MGDKDSGGDEKKECDSSFLYVNGNSDEIASFLFLAHSLSGMIQAHLLILFCTYSMPFSSCCSTFRWKPIDGIIIIVISNPDVFK